jgi:cytochrome b561
VADIGEAGIEDHYDSVTMRLHWATAALVTILWTMGRLTVFLPKGPLRLDIWSVHVLLGFTLAIVILSRIGWRIARGRKLPAPEQGDRHLLATAVHALLYILLVGVAGLGILNVLAHGFPMFGIWHFPKIGDANYDKVVNGWHNLFANIIAGVAAFHACAALFHHHVIKDRVLGRMWPAMLAGR